VADGVELSTHYFGPLAQLVEQETLNLLVVGSIPTRPTIKNKKIEVCTTTQIATRQTARSGIQQRHRGRLDFQPRSTEAAIAFCFSISFFASASGGGAACANAGVTVGSVAPLGVLANP
jgi:hypothetical protein